MPAMASVVYGRSRTERRIASATVREPRARSARFLALLGRIAHDAVDAGFGVLERGRAPLAISSSAAL